MFDRVKFGVSDFAASRAFDLKALAPPGLQNNIEAVCHAPKPDLPSLCVGMLPAV